MTVSGPAFSSFPVLQAHISCGRPSLAEDEAVHVVRQVGPRHFGFSALDPNGADEVPDTSTPEWVAHIERTAVFTRGRPKSDNPKVAQTLRLDAEVLAYFKGTGVGWQTRMNEALRKAAGLS